MRDLTHYELRVLIKNIVDLIGQEAGGHHGLSMNIDWLGARCEEINSYVVEYNLLKKKEEA